MSLDYPEINPFLETAENGEKRKELLMKSSRKGGEENLKLLSEIVRLKIKKAKLLGYQNYPDYILEDRMAKKAENVKKFIEPLLEKVQKPALAELEELRKYRGELENNPKVKIEPHDIAFYSHKLKKEKFAVDENDLKNYFPLERVKKEMFKIFSKLFGFEIKKNNRLKL